MADEFYDDASWYDSITAPLTADESNFYVNGGMSDADWGSFYQSLGGWSDDIDWSSLFDTSDLGYYDDWGSTANLSNEFPDHYFSNEGVSDLPSLSDEQYASMTGNPTDTELSDWVNGMDIPMDQKIQMLQDLKVQYGLVDEDAYGERSPVTSPDEQKTSVASSGPGWLQKAASALLKGSTSADGKKQPSGLQQMLAAAQLALATKKALSGKNNAPTVKGRSNTASRVNARGASGATAPMLTYKGSPNTQTQYLKKGGPVQGALPQIALMQLLEKSGRIQGNGGGQDDVVPVKAAPGEYMFDAETVAQLGDGNTEEGARKLDQMRVNIRKHKRSAKPESIPPRSKKPEQYLKGGK